MEYIGTTADSSPEATSHVGGDDQHHLVARIRVLGIPVRQTAIIACDAFRKDPSYAGKVFRCSMATPEVEVGIEVSRHTRDAGCNHR
jgi:hypothetical protein